MSNSTFCIFDIIVYDHYYHGQESYIRMIFSQFSMGSICLKVVALVGRKTACCVLMSKEKNSWLNCSSGRSAAIYQSVYDSDCFSRCNDNFEAVVWQELNQGPFSYELTLDHHHHSSIWGQKKLVLSKQKYLT